jgi:hypothetical protein
MKAVRFLQAYASSAIVEIVISNPDFDGANRLALDSHFAEEAIRYRPELGQYPILIGNVFSNCRERDFLGFRVSPFDLLGPRTRFGFCSSLLPPGKGEPRRNPPECSPPFSIARQFVSIASTAKSFAPKCGSSSS